MKETNKESKSAVAVVFVGEYKETEAMLPLMGPLCFVF